MMIDQLPTFELRAYQFISIASVAYLFYKNYLLSQSYLRIITSFYEYNSFNIAFKYGWFDIPKDISDIEWEYNLDLFKNIYPWVLIQIIVSKTLKKLKYNQVLKFWYLSVSILFLWVNFNYVIIGIHLLFPVIFYTILKLSSPNKRIYYIWICTIINLVVLVSFELTFVPDDLQFYVHVAQFWLLLKSISYSIDCKNGDVIDLWDFLAYVFYLPLFHVGPIIKYEDFKVIYVSDSNTQCSFHEFVLQMVRFCGWMLVYEALLHVFYVNSFDLYFLDKQDNWQLFSIGYISAQYFHLKYFVTYGLSITVSKFEGVIVPSYPKCVSTFRLFSKTWKYFDNGLYKFLTTYIYIPLLQSLQNVPILRNKLFSCLICFLFIFVWHGVHDFIFVWSFLNFVGLCIENIAWQLSHTTFYQNYVTRRFSAPMLRRFKCFLSVPLLTCSYFSSFVFLMQSESGFMFLKRSPNGDLFDYFAFYTFLYCMCQIIYEIETNRQDEIKQFHMLSFQKTV